MKEGPAERCVHAKGLGDVVAAFVRTRDYPRPRVIAVPAGPTVGTARPCWGAALVLVM